MRVPSFGLPDINEVVLSEGRRTIATDDGGRAESPGPGRYGMTFVVPEEDGRILRPVLVA